MGEVKVFRLKGKMRKPLKDLTFTREVVALTKEHALEKVYSEMGSRHKVSRKELTVETVEEIGAERG